MTLGALARGRAALYGVGFGAAYGLFARYVASIKKFDATFGVVTIAFLFVVPIVIGYLAVRPSRAPSWPFRIFAPWLPLALSVLAAAVLGWEGAICIYMGAPLLLLLSSVGGMIGASGAARHPAVTSLLLVLPYATAPLERGRPLPREVVESVTAITIAAPPERVWPLVASVDSIRPAEQRPALFTSMGFPRPVSATISHHGVGGVRLARFEGGVVFTETVTEWEPNRRLHFTIDPNTDAIPATTLDQHVTIGGRYFDVLTGTYELVPLPGGHTRLVLRSAHRVSTPANFYASWWVERIMRSIQSNILEVLRDRAEGGARRGG